VPFILAQTSTQPPPPHGIWYPTILGILVVVAAVGLFCGSIYVLLATNLGARLGFLLAFTGVTGFMVLLTLLWITTASPINTLKGTIPSWSVQAVLSNPAKDKSLPAEVRDIAKTGRPMSMTLQQAVKAAADARLVTATPIANIPLLPNANQFAVFSASTDYQETTYRQVGGSTPRLVSWQLTHKPLYAVVGYCALNPDTLPFGLPPPTPTSDTAHPKTGFVVLAYNYGSLRIPPLVAFLCSLILFGLGLLGLHWRERDERAAEKAKAEAEAEAESEKAEARTPEPVGV
jgi:hypothetical protein